MRRDPRNSIRRRVTLGLAIPASAQAATGIGTHGPATEASGWFPERCEDAAGTRRALCVAGAHCLTALEAGVPAAGWPAAAPDNSPDEPVSWSPDGTLTYPG